jgi:hypothetical protein
MFSNRRFYLYTNINNVFYELIYQLSQYRSIVIVKMPCNRANANITIAIFDQSNDDGDENSI